MVDRSWVTCERVRVKRSVDGFEGAQHDENDHVGDEEVRGEGEDTARLADPAEIDVGDEDDEARSDPDGCARVSEWNTDVRAATPAATETATVRV